MFLTIGPIKSSKIIQDRATGYSYGFGFVDYEHPEDAARAVQTLNGLHIENKRIKVALARPSGLGVKGANVYVSHLPNHYAQSDLVKLFEPYGIIIRSRIMTHPNTNQSKGVGFVLYDQKKMAEAAIADLNQTIPPGGSEPIIVKFANEAPNSKKTRPPHEQYMNNNNSIQQTFSTPMLMRNERFTSPVPVNYSPNNPNPNPNNDMSNSPVLFIYNTGNMDESDLGQLFCGFGTVQKANIVRVHQKTKGYGFVTMANQHEAENAVGRLNGYRYRGWGPLQVSFKNK
ncbi:ELAV 1 [Octopus vulgaris]|uniref:ELAV 1 n=3 Tax=Octopus TaxID=6643 RepID=A0AA36BQV0_OCTVU|nr:ELAV 1 [Octopus vulgaris]